MRKFLCNPFNDVEVDLDDPQTYKHLPQTAKELRDMMFSEIGYYHCYVNYWHKTDWSNAVGQAQKERVDKLITYFTENEKKNYGDVLWYQEQIFLFQDEIENMC